MLKGGRAHALYSPCRPVPVKKRFLQSLSAGHRTACGFSPIWLGRRAAPAVPKKGGATRFRHAASSLFSPPNEGVDIQGNRAASAVPEPERAFVPRNGPGVWQRRTIPGRKLPRRPPLAALGPAGQRNASGRAAVSLFQSRNRFFYPQTDCRKRRERREKVAPSVSRQG